MKMRKFLALAAVVLAASFSMPASAQSVGGLLNLLNGGRNMSNMLRYSCSGGGIEQAACQMQRANSVSQQFEYQRQQMRNREMQAQQRQQRVSEALVRACKLGDQDSCMRAGPAADPRQSQLQQALQQACDAGDRYSCSRADSIRRNAYSAQTQYRSAQPDAYAQSQYRAPQSGGYAQTPRYRVAPADGYYPRGY